MNFQHYICTVANERIDPLKKILISTEYFEVHKILLEINKGPFNFDKKGSLRLEFV